ncbi:MAG: DUF2065 domain-containing protein [Gammaproteobacteria bacterium]|nr:DUF2065 domain-containing protein [Gammaproteobacteria bacterium]MDT8371574.1 DUF2065 domain-containing protein [Gammaproteobacteria bacterium]
MNDALLNSLWVASALMLVIEGIMPFLNPNAFRRALLQMANMQDMQLRTIGLFSMILGVVILYWVH